MVRDRRTEGSQMPQLHGQLRRAEGFRRPTVEGKTLSQVTIPGITGRDLMRTAFSIRHSPGRLTPEHDRLKEITATPREVTTS
ncbi:MAG: hypothetical protein AB7S99_08675 [Pseudodonghicola sp.]